MFRLLHRKFYIKISNGMPGFCPTNKYSEGYPGKRYYGGPCSR